MILRVGVPSGHSGTNHERNTTGRFNRRRAANDRQSERRTILQVLREGEGTAVPAPVLVGELTDADAPSTHHSIDNDSQTLIELAHKHLPKLDAYGVVSFDETANMVAPGPEFDAVETVLRLLEMHADELPTGYVSEEAVVSGE